MKILILQLARLGDIYLTWPMLRAMKRTRPDVEIHVLSRAKFRSAWQGCEAVDEIHELQASNILGALVQENPDVHKAFADLGQWVDSLGIGTYDEIYNLSFSPASSYLTSLLVSPKTIPFGYTRFTDGYLNITDDMSAYFYAQVGLGRPNRFHLAEIFASMASLDLRESDWMPAAKTPKANKTSSIVVHVGASETQKTLSPDKWSAILAQLCKITDKKLILIGAENECEIAERILSSVSGDQVENRVGKTHLRDVFALLEQADLLIGGDSAPIHMASLTQTPTLNLSVGAVNFWETGPRAPRSLILRSDDENDLGSDRVAQVVERFFSGQPQDLAVIQLIKAIPCYRCLNHQDQEFQWNLVQAIYQGHSFPEPLDQQMALAIDQLFDVNELMLEQLESIRKGLEVQKLAGIMDRGEEIFQALGQLAPNLAPLVRWYQTEKLRIGPGPQEAIVERSRDVHNLLKKVLTLYRAPENLEESL